MRSTNSARSSIPATNLLVEHDFEYRFNAAGVKAIVCSADGDIAHQVDLAAPRCETLKTNLCQNTEKHIDGWHDFNSEFKDFPDVYKRTATSARDDPMLMFFTSGTTGYPKIAAHSHKYALGHFITATLLAQRRPGRHPLHDLRHRLGQGALGQAVRSVALRGCRFHL